MTFAIIRSDNLISILVKVHKNLGCFFQNSSLTYYVKVSAHLHESKIAHANFAVNKINMKEKTNKRPPAKSVHSSAKKAKLSSKKSSKAHATKKHKFPVVNIEAEVLPSGKVNISVKTKANNNAGPTQEQITVETNNKNTPVVVSAPKNAPITVQGKKKGSTLKSNKFKSLRKLTLAEKKPLALLVTDKDALRIPGASRFTKRAPPKKTEDEEKKEGEEGEKKEGEEEEKKEGEEEEKKEGEEEKKDEFETATFDFEKSTSKTSRHPTSVKKSYSKSSSKKSVSNKPPLVLLETDKNVLRIPGASRFTKRAPPKKAAGGEDEEKKEGEDEEKKEGEDEEKKEGEDEEKKEGEEEKKDEFEAAAAGLNLTRSTSKPQSASSHKVRKTTKCSSVTGNIKPMNFLVTDKDALRIPGASRFTKRAPPKKAEDEEKKEGEEGEKKEGEDEEKKEGEDEEKKEGEEEKKDEFEAATSGLNLSRYSSTSKRPSKESRATVTSEDIKPVCLRPLQPYEKRPMALLVTDKDALRIPGASRFTKRAPPKKAEDEEKKEGEEGEKKEGEEEEKKEGEDEEKKEGEEEKKDEFEEVRNPSHSVKKASSKSSKTSSKKSLSRKSFV